ncbi:hypothetical protein BOTBODRAFT_55308 [Botryobasidium botryosum FD-172 SS1]|uniref:Methyltransferase domain-containing protein n=1 Tax=Botryobasidium botryosum (strain FD-172 SS1) TaxID=930990 RepID=A0A067MG15_BOTB1|nr:hypothetical protein BOTBODRAFT_55308 [Botryobasidium botryosum FD-172 SS1]
MLRKSMENVRRRHMLQAAHDTVPTVCANPSSSAITFAMPHPSRLRKLSAQKRAASSILKRSHHLQPATLDRFRLDDKVDFPSVECVEERLRSPCAEDIGFPEYTPYEPREFVWREGTRCHGYNEQLAPYPVSYDSVMLEADRHALHLLTLVAPHKLTFHNFGSNPPKNVLDLGCGDGAWIRQALCTWTHSHFTGFDLANIQTSHAGSSSARLSDSTLNRVKWKHGNFLHEVLPFPNKSFDFIRVAYMNLSIPSEKLPFVMGELQRVLAPEGVLEIIDEDLYFSSLPAPNSTDERLENDFKMLLEERRLTSNLNQLQGLLNERFGAGEEQPPIELVTAALDEALSKRKAHKVLGTPPPPAGLILLPDTLIPMVPEQLEPHLSRVAHILLGCKGALWKQRLMSSPDASNEEFEEDMHNYERNRYSRIGLSPPASSFSSMWDSDTDDEDSPSSDESLRSQCANVLGRRSKRKAERPSSPSLSHGFCLRPARTIRVWHAMRPLH